MNTYGKQKSIDSFCQKKKERNYFDWSLFKYVQKYKKTSLLFSKIGKIDNFTTNNLQIHFLKTDQKAIFDSVDGFIKFQKRVPIRYAIKNRQHFSDLIVNEYGSYKKYFQNIFQDFFSEMSFTKVWNVSIVGSLVFGMFLMTFIYRYLDQGAAAVTSTQINPSAITREIPTKPKGKVLGVSTSIKKDKAFLLKQEKLKKQKQFQKGIEKIVKGYPIEKMVPYIAQQDKEVVAFLIGIAKQESSWGKHVPVLNGQDCYNYWGFRRKREKMGSGGHTCFNNPQDAVETVASRIKYLIEKKKVNTPKKMVVVWKCGYDCSQDNPQAVKRWINAVDMYSKKVKKITQ